MIGTGNPATWAMTMAILAAQVLQELEYALHIAQAQVAVSRS
jgi:hypothetical protein